MATVITWSLSLKRFTSICVLAALHNIVVWRLCGYSVSFQSRLWLFCASGQFCVFVVVWWWVSDSRALSPILFILFGQNFQALSEWKLKVLLISDSQIFFLFKQTTWFCELHKATTSSTQLWWKHKEEQVWGHSSQVENRDCSLWLDHYPQVEKFNK